MKNVVFIYFFLASFCVSFFVFEIWFFLDKRANRKKKNSFLLLGSYRHIVARINKKFYAFSKQQKYLYVQKMKISRIEWGFGWIRRIFRDCLCCQLTILHLEFRVQQTRVNKRDYTVLDLSLYSHFFYFLLQRLE